MRRLRIESVCDRHGEAEPVEGRTLVVAIDGGEQTALELCPACEAELVGPLRELLEERGRTATDDDRAQLPTPARRRRRKASGGGVRGEYPCPEDGCTFVGKSAAGTGAHRRHRHGKSKAADLAEQAAESA